MPDHHKLISTAAKFGKFIGTSKKKKKKKKSYRYYKNFDIAKFGNTLKGDLKRVNDNIFENVFLNALNNSAPLKTKMLRFNNSTFRSKKTEKG